MIPVRLPDASAGRRPGIPFPSPAMKVLHLPFTYYPDPPGGTEVYVAALVRHLEALAISGVIAAPSPRAAAESYEVLGQRVHRFPVPPPRDLRDMYGDGSADAAMAVRRIIEIERPDVVHMHAFTRGVSVRVAREARAAGLPLVFTYHTPTVSCQRGTLLRYGRIPCDGKILVTRCSACVAQQQGAGMASWLLALVPRPLGSLIGRLGLTGRLWAGLRLTDLLWRRKRAFVELMGSAAVVVAVSDWVRDLLQRNGVPDARIVVSRQGTDALPANPRVREPNTGRPLRAVMLGRLDATKGLDVVLEALLRIPDAVIQLDVYGVDQSGGAERPDIRALLDRDPRVRVLPPFNPEDAARVISGYDLTLVPSQVLETGPLVVLESFAAGVPVIGSRLGGIAERVRHGVDGLLVEAGDRAAWSDALTRVIDEPGLLASLASGVQPPRTMREVAEEMRRVYLEIAAGHPAGSATAVAEPA